MQSLLRPSLAASLGLPLAVMYIGGASGTMSWRHWYKVLLVHVVCLLCCTACVFCEIFTDRWVVEVDSDTDVDKLASEHGFVNLGQIFDNFFALKKRRVLKRSVRASHHISWRLQSHPKVRSASQQMEQIRVKRDYNLQINDTHWINGGQWYLDDPDQQVPDLNVVPAWKRCYSGKGVAVVVVDDGIDYRNRDFRNNYNKSISYDVQGNKKDPFPESAESNHGTRAAGMIAAEANDFCGLGIAYRAEIGAIRIFDGTLTDDIEATALVKYLNKIDIYSNSWGPPENGNTLGPVGPLTQKAIQKGIQHGRRGRGAIYIWSAGNGGVWKDSCAYDGYVNSIYTIAVNAVAKTGKMLYSTEKCSAIMVASYSKNKGDRYPIVTTDYSERGCTTEFRESSAAAPAVAGVIALALEANPHLTWRDIQHLIAQTANSNVNFEPKDWIVNAANYRVSPTWGFGLIDAGEMVNYALRWTKSTVGRQRSCTYRSSRLRHFPGAVYQYLDPYKCGRGNYIRYLEHVEVYVNLSFCARGFVRAILYSPKKTRSVVLPSRPYDYHQSKLNWTVSSLHFWGEDPRGEWWLQFENSDSKYNCSKGTLSEWGLIIYGTDRDPRRNLRLSGGTTLRSSLAVCKVTPNGLRQSGPEKAMLLIYIMAPVVGSILFAVSACIGILLCRYQRANRKPSRSSSATFSRVEYHPHRHKRSADV